MKTLVKSIFVAAIIALGFSQSFATMSYAKISWGPRNGEKAGSKIVKLECSNGTCTASVDDMTAGKFTIALCDAQGNPLALKVKEKGNRTKSGSMNSAKVTFEYDVKAPRDVATGQSSGKRIAAPRDVATGQSSGKRQHGIVKIVKEVEASKSFVAAGDLDSDGMLDIKITWTFTDGGITAEDDWEAPIN